MYGEGGYTGRQYTPFYFKEKRVLCDGDGCADKYDTHIKLYNNTFHEAVIDVPSALAEMIGMPSAFRLRGGGIKEELRDNKEIYQRRLEKVIEGTKPCIKTEFPPFLGITSPIARKGMLGDQTDRVLAILECGGEIDEKGRSEEHTSELQSQ